MGYTKEQIKTVCMYCEKILANPDGIVTSHGICDKCAAENWPEEEREGEKEK